MTPALKIVHVETGLHLYGGAQQVAYLLGGLATRGVENVLVCPPGAAIGQHFQGSAVRVVELPCGGDVDLGFLWRLRALLQREQPDLVHLHSRRGADVLGGLAARWAGIPAVLSRRVDNPEARWWAQRKYRLYRRTVCISQGIADVLLAEGVDPTRVRVVRSIVDAAPWQVPVDRAALRREFGLPAQGLVFGVVAQLIERKGHRVLMRALQRLPSREGLVILCFGQGPLREALEQEARDQGLGEVLRFAGFRKDLQRWMGGLDALVHPALMEGLGVSLLQASAASVPVIASRAGGMPEAVRDGENGLLVPPGDDAALAEALRRLIDDAALRRRLGDGGRALIAREFSIDAMVEGNRRVYSECLGENLPGFGAGDQRIS